MARGYRPSLVSLTDLVEDPGRVSRWLYRAPTAGFVSYVAVAAWGTLLCALAAGAVLGAADLPGRVVLPGLGEVSTKRSLEVAQLAGLATGQLVGVGVVSELPASKRALALGVLVAVAEASLVLFALLPDWLGALCLYANGVPLGMVWGLVFGYLEGRRVSDVLGPLVASAPLLGVGLVTWASRWVLGLGVGAQAMPAVTAALFAVPLPLFVWLLAQVPPPTNIDAAERLHREPMDAGQRWEFFARLAPGLLLLSLAFVAFSVYRAVRERVAPALWVGPSTSVLPDFATMDALGVAGALVAVLIVGAVRDNHRAVHFLHGLLLAAPVAIGVGTFLHQVGVIDAASWMIVVGFAVYLGVIPYHCVLFDRLIPAVGVVGTAGFVIYVALAFGSLGTLAVAFFEALVPNLDWGRYFGVASWLTVATTVLALLASKAYFRARSQQLRTAVSLDGGL